MVANGTDSHRQAQVRATGQSRGHFSTPAVIEQESITRVSVGLLEPARCPVPQRRRNEVLRRDLRAILGDGAAFSAMVGIGETYLSAFALAIGTGEVASGLVASIPLLAGALLQLASPWAVRRCGSHRRWVVLCASCQALTFAPLIGFALRGAMPPGLIFMIAAVYWGSGMATGPAWNTWVGRIVPQRLRAGYFARRTRISQAAVLAGFVVGGFSLQAGAAWGRPLLAFALLFLVAGLCRSISVAFLASQSEVHPTTSKQKHVPAREFFARVIRPGEGRLLLYLLGVQGAVQISGPYFTPFMLKQLHFSYGTYVMLIACSYLAKSLAVPIWGRLAAKYGTYRLLWIGGAGIVPVSAMWLVSTSLPWLVFVQLTGGALWAAYELAMFLLFFEAIVDEERTSVLTTYNLAQAISTVGGSLIGGMILLTWGREPNTYLMIFGLSALARACTLVFLFRASDVPVRTFQMATRTLAIRPEGSVDRPIVASLPIEESEQSEPRGLAAFAAAAARTLKRYRVDTVDAKQPIERRGKRRSSPAESTAA